MCRIRTANILVGFLLFACEVMPPATYTHAVLSSIGGPYDSDAVVNVRHWQLRHRLGLNDIRSFAKLSLRQQESLTKLTKAWHAPVNIYSAGQRALVELAADHPAGPIKILLTDDHNDITIFTADGRRFSEPRHRLADLLDCTQSALFHDTQQRIVAVKGRRSTSPGLGFELEFRYRPNRKRPSEWRMQLNAEFHPVPHAPVGPIDNSVLHTALPFLPQHQLTTLGNTLGAPKYWSSQIVNRSLPSKLAANWLSRVEDMRWLPLPARRFARTRPGYRATNARFRCSARGKQLIAASQLFWLRRGTVGGTLQMKNRSKFAAYVYVDGIRIGFIGSRSDFTFTGLPDGYYRIYATTPSGLKSWGPRDTYIPGPLTLH
jgi:hypothetical protein